MAKMLIASAANPTFDGTVELARGSVADRPWGLTLGSLALRRVSGEIVVAADNKRCAIALLDGVVVAASSSFAADSIARVALTSHLVSSTHVGEITRQLAAFPDRDEVDVLAKATQLSPELAQRLRARLIAQRAARTFSIDGGTFVVDDQVSLQMRGSEVDIRAVVYQGARLYLSEQRLVDDLRQLGSHFTLDPQAFDQLQKFGFSDEEMPIVNALRTGASLPELEALHREIDPRTTQSVVYALASCKAVTVLHTARTPTPPLPPLSIEQPAPPRPGSSPGIARTVTPTDGIQIGRVATKTGVARTTTGREPMGPRTITPRDPLVPRTETQPFTGRPSRGATVDDRADPPATGRAQTRPPTGGDRGPTTARTQTGREPIRDRVDMARAPIPARTGTAPHLGMRAPTAREPAQGRVPTKPPLTRAPSHSGLAEPRTVTSQDNRQLAEEAFKRGDGSMRAENFDAALVELERACELSPGNLHYAAILAWVQFCMATDKEDIAADTRRVLEKAIFRGDKPVVATFYLGRVERMLGREADALRRFRDVIEQEPSHAGAASEVRILEARIAANAKR